MQILLITNLYPPQELGGYGRSMADFAWGLMQSGHHVQVLCANAPHLGEKAMALGEEVSRCLTLKGSFEGDYELIVIQNGAQTLTESIKNGFVIGWADVNGMVRWSGTWIC